MASFRLEGCPSCGCVAGSQLLRICQDDTALLATLRAGAQPSDTVMPLLLTELEGLRATARVFEEELHRIRSKLDELQSAIDRRESALHSPIRRLPDEIMADIFDSVWSSYEDAPYDIVMTAKDPDPPTFLPSRSYPVPHVCAWWRRLSMDSQVAQPELRIRLGTVDGLPQGHLEKVLAGVPYPFLRLRLQDVKYCLNIVDSVTSSAPRWRDVALIDPCSTQLLSVGSMFFPHLIHLELGFLMHGVEAESWSFTDTETRPLLFGNTPELSQLSLDMEGVPPALERLPFGLAWNQLTVVHVNDCPSHICAEVITLCINLRSFSWRDDRLQWELEDYVPSPQCGSWSLRRLSLEQDQRFPSNATEGFLAGLTLPSLVSLRALCVPFAPILPFLRRSGCHLTSFEIVTSSSIMEDRRELKDIFSALPELEDIRFQYNAYYDRVEMDGTSSGQIESFAWALRDILCLHGPPPDSPDSQAPDGRQQSFEYLPRLKRLSFSFPERIHDELVTAIATRRVDKWEPRLDPPQTLREVWLETPLSEGCIKTLEKLATKYGIEINGLNKCAALYDALLPEDWAGSPWSRYADSSSYCTVAQPSSLNEGRTSEYRSSAA
ncbi:hypothetical protein GGF50DRAFT_47985 [Schizophyllum commune]